MKKSSPKGHKVSAMSKHQKILIGVATAFLLYSVIGFLVLPAVLKNVLEKKLSENLNRTVTIETVQVNPFLYKVSINNFHIKSLVNDDHFVAFDHLFVDIESFSLIKRALVIKVLKLIGPRVNLARYKDLSYNFSDLLDSSQAKEKTDTGTFHFSVNYIEIIDGSIIFLDEPKDTTHKVEKLNLTVPFLSNVKHEVEIHVKPAFSAIINDTPINLSGRTMPFHDTRRTVFDIQANEINIPEYLAYLPKSGNLTLKSGYLDIKAILGFEMQSANKPAITLTGDFSLKEINVTEMQGESYLTIPQIDVTILDSSPLLKDFHLSGISLQEPEFLLRRNSDGDILPLALLEKKTEPKPPGQDPSDKETGFNLVVDKIVLNGGTIRFEDQNNAEQFKTIFHPVEIEVTGLSNLEGAEASYDISMQTGTKENILLNGKMSLNPLLVELHGTFKDLQIPRFSPYYAEIITPEVMSGSLDLSADLTYSKTDDTETIRLDNITTQVDSILINDKETRELLTIPSLAIKDTSLDLNAKHLNIGNFISNNAKLNLVRQKGGLVIVNELLRPRDTPKQNAKSGTGTSSPWTVTLQKGVIDEYSIVLEDHVPAEPATVLLDKIHLSAENISTIEKSKGSIDLGLRVDEKGIISIKGPLTIKPLSTSLAIDVAKLQVRNLQPYFSEKVNVAESSGSVSLNGQLEVSRDKNKEIATLFRGNGSITDFSTYDKVAGEEFLKWKNLRFDGIEYDSSRFAFRIKEIGWEEFHNRIVVFEDGVVNVKTIMKDSGQADTEVNKKREPQKDKKSFQVQIDSVKLENGKIDFLDRNITPNYTGSFSELSGTITGLSSQSEAMAEANIGGKLNQHAPLIVTGKINPLSDQLYVDLVVNFKNIELSPTTPYTGKYIGYTVSKGKLSLDLKYQVENKKLIGENKAFLDQFTLGDTVDSPDAVNLPISLAISLLKNRNGEITLNVPVKGELDDPEFSVGGIVFKAILKLIAKAATSPFALLGALVPDGEDLQFIDFEAGSSKIGEDYTQKLETIAKVLYDRPGLEMDIKGSVNTEQERLVLHNNQFEKLLKNEKYKKLSKKEDAEISIDEIVIEPEEYNTFLKQAYKKATFEKPKNALGLTKKLPPEEMEKLLRDNIIITDDDLRLLAIQRAKTVKSFLVETGPVEPERLFIVEPKTGEEGSGTRQVEMIIK